MSECPCSGPSGTVAPRKRAGGMPEQAHCAMVEDSPGFISDQQLLEIEKAWPAEDVLSWARFGACCLTPHIHAQREKLPTEGTSCFFNVLLGKSCSLQQ